MKTIVKILCLILIFILPRISKAGEVNVAVASNFAAPVEQIALAFQQETGHKAVISIGSSGKFYTQIKYGAPFQILLSADDETPARLEKEGDTVLGTRFTYATGRLVLWSKKRGIVDDKGEVLKNGTFDRIAIADPKLAPYGFAAIQTLAKLGIEKQITQKAVWGENIGQTFLFVDTQSTPLGFVALSQVIMDNRLKNGSAWIVPETLHSPIKQDAVLLLSGKENAAAHAFIKFLKSNKAQEIIKAFGYQI